MVSIIGMISTSPQTTRWFLADGPYTSRMLLAAKGTCPTRAVLLKTVYVGITLTYQRKFMMLGECPVLELVSRDIVNRSSSIRPKQPRIHGAG